MSEENRTPKTKEDLEALKKEITDLNKKIAELTEDERKEIGICFRDLNELAEGEMAKVTGGKENAAVPGIRGTNIFSPPFPGEAEK